MKLTKKFGLSIVILISFGAIVAIGIYQNPLRTYQKAPADRYFEVVSAGVEPTGRERIEENGTIWILYGITFRIKAIGGDAHNVIVLSWAMSGTYWIGDILKGNYGDATMISDAPYKVEEKNGVFPVQVRISSDEAEGQLTLYLR